MASDLPLPAPAALACSAKLTALIRQQIAAQGGWLPFSDYMRLALYAPGLGYYSGGSQKFGAAGDFITAPELSPLFAGCVAQTVAATLRAVGGDVLEFGAGSGRLAADLLAALAASDVLPERYCIVELSAELRQRQQQTLAAAVPQLMQRIVWLDSLPASFTGCIVGNEVLDAMPCALVYRAADGGLHERGVICADAGLALADRPAGGAVLAAASALDLPCAYQTELLLEANGFMASLAQLLSAGSILLFDYGFPAAEFYHPQRSEGTLMCHYRHQAHGDALLWPGLQDITCHVDFSAIYHVANAAGLSLEGYVSQGQYLLDAGLLPQLAQIDPNDLPRYVPAAAAAQKLLSPAEMGELFKAIAFSRNLPLEGLLPGFRRDDRSSQL